MIPLLLSLLFPFFLLPDTGMGEGKPYLVIDKQAMTLTYYEADGKAAAVYGIACGVAYGNKTRRGDHKTPEGTFKITQLLRAKGLSHDFQDGKGPVKDAYGPWFFRLGVPGYIDIGIHGTHLPESIGTRATEGCIRLRNEDILRLRPHVFVGMQVTILPDPSYISR